MAPEDQTPTGPPGDSDDQTIGLVADAPKIPGHRIIRILGEGGMGRVYLAEDTTLGRKVAIKVVSEALSTNPEAHERFLREARTIAGVEHPNLVRVYAFGTAGGRDYLVMEYVQGESLAQRIRRRGALPAAEALDILGQVADGLSAAWNKRIVHRDIKPANILLDAEDRVRVADFGLAKSVRFEHEPSLTSDGSLLGTPHYVSPEQARGESALDFRTDIYSLGIVLYEMLTGQPPYRGSTPYAVVEQHLNSPLPSPRERTPELDESVERLAVWMTEKDRDERPSSYADLQQAIDSSSGHGPPAMVRPAPGLVTPWRLRGLRLDALFALVLIALVVGSVVLLKRLIAPADGAPGASRTAEFTVAISPFHGADEASAKEGRLMAALVQRAVADRLADRPVNVLGIDETGTVVRSQSEAQELGQQLGASLVIWGEVFAFADETEISPALTLVPPAVGTRDYEYAQSYRAGAFAAQIEGAVGPSDALSLVLEAGSSEQIGRRRTRASKIGEIAVLAAAMHALYLQEDPEEGLRLLERATDSWSCLFTRARAFETLGRFDGAVEALGQACELEPTKSDLQAALADALVRAGRFAEAYELYQVVLADSPALTTRIAIPYRGRLYAKETYTSQLFTNGQPVDTRYMIAIDPDTGQVVERYWLPGTLRSLKRRGNGLEVGYLAAPFHLAQPFIGFEDGSFDRPVYPGPDLSFRVHSVRSGWARAANFVADTQAHGFNGRFGLRDDERFDDAPSIPAELEQELRQAMAADPTQPWHALFLGFALWAQEQHAEAEETWQAMLAGDYPGIPYYDYGWMAAVFEKNGQPQWADRAYEGALQRRLVMDQPVGQAGDFQWFIYLPAIKVAAREPTDDLDRRHQWLVRARTLVGGGNKYDAFAARAWAEHFEQQGDTARAEQERAIFAEIRSRPLSLPNLPAVVDYSSRLAWAAAWAFVALLTTLPFRVGRREWAAIREAGGATAGQALGLRRLLAAVRRGEWRLLLVAISVVVVLFACSGVLARQLVSARLAAGMGDSLGHVTWLHLVDTALEERSGDEVRFAAAVAHHLAGDADRARVLYRTLSGDDRAVTNLEALDQGQPPADLPGVDVRLLRRLTWAEMFDLSPALGPFWFWLWPTSHFLPWLLLTGLVATLVLLVPISRRPIVVASGALWQRLEGARRMGGRLLYTFVPGLRDLLTGSLTRGWLTVGLLWAVLLALMWLTDEGHRPVYGFASSFWYSFVKLFRSIPLPTPPSVDPREYHTWTLVGAFPLFKTYWTVVAGCALAAGCLHVRQVVELWRGRERSADEP